MRSWAVAHDERVPANLGIPENHEYFIWQNLSEISELQIFLQNDDSRTSRLLAKPWIGFASNGERNETINFRNVLWDSLTLLKEGGILAIIITTWSLLVGFNYIVYQCAVSIQLVVECFILSQVKNSNDYWKPTEKKTHLMVQNKWKIITVRYWVRYILSNCLNDITQIRIWIVENNFVI